MKLSDLYRQYLSGELEKREYIKMMHKKHQALFDYFDYIKGTDVKLITIDNDSIYITVKGSDIKLLLNESDSRFIPIEMLNFRSIEPQEKKQPPSQDKRAILISYGPHFCNYFF